MKKHINTVCGLKKYEELVKRKGILSKLRFYWFVFFAVISDFVKKKINERDYHKYTNHFLFPENISVGKIVESKYDN